MAPGQTVVKGVGWETMLMLPKVRATALVVALPHPLEATQS